MYVIGSEWGGRLRGVSVGERIGFWLYQSCKNRGSVGHVSVCLGCGGVGGVRESGWVAWARIWEGGVVLCLCVCCESGLFV